jgi:hypothetical protein
VKQSILKFKLSVLFIFSAVIFLGGKGIVFAQTSTIQTQVKELPQPTIAINPDIYYPLDEVLYIEGGAEPNFMVQIRFEKQGAKPTTFTAKSDSRGEWVLAEKIPLAAGDWEVRARIVDKQNKDNFSDWSNPRVFKVILNGITIGGVNIKFAVLSLIIIILLIGGVALILYFKHRVQRLKEVILDKEIGEAQESVREGFSELRQSLSDELRVLDSRPNLSQEELARKEQVLRNLENLEHNIERNIQKEIKDIEDKL